VGIDVDVLDGSGIFNYTYVVKAVCHNCRQWNGGALNVNTTKQPWIYAVGPGRPFSSNSKTASIGLHDAYGGPAPLNCNFSLHVLMLSRRGVHHEHDPSHRCWRRSRFGDDNDWRRVRRECSHQLQLFQAVPRVIHVKRLCVPVPARHHLR
jgi:hypothetical protein